VIPARSGSGRIADKNIHPLAGRPMMAWPLAAARASGLFEEIHLSTDSRPYADLAGRLGFPVPFLRPDDLAANQGSLMDTLRWVLAEFERRGRRFDRVCLIYATAVLLEAEDLRRGLALLERHGADLPVLSVGKSPGPLERALAVDADGVLRWLDPAQRFRHSQECGRAYFDAAGFFFADAGRLRADSQAVVEAFRPLVLPAWKICDINEPEDLETAAVLLAGRKALSDARSH
jgi:N-acylneuraminate cytidylyltransferase